MTPTVSTTAREAPLEAALEAPRGASSDASSDAPPSTPNTVALLLRDRDRCDALCAQPDAAARLLPRFIGVAALGIAAWAGVQGLLLSLCVNDLAVPGLTGEPAWFTAGVLFLAYEGGLMGAQVAGLPTFSFYGLMAGFQTHPGRIATESLRARATAAVVLLGLLPVHLAVGLGLVLFFDQPSAVGAFWQGLLLLGGGMVLPFVAGLAAPGSLVRVFRGLARAAAERPDGERRPMPVLLAVAWSAVFTVMAPLGVFRIVHLLVG